MGVAVWRPRAQNLETSGQRQDRRQSASETYCRAISPRAHSPAGRGLSGFRSASMVMSAICRATFSSSTSVRWSNTKNRAIRLQPVRERANMGLEMALARRTGRSLRSSKCGYINIASLAVVATLINFLDGNRWRTYLYLRKSQRSKARCDRASKQLKLRVHSWHAIFASS